MHDERNLDRDGSDRGKSFRTVHPKNETKHLSLVVAKLSTRRYSLNKLLSVQCLPFGTPLGKQFVCFRHRASDIPCFNRHSSVSFFSANDSHQVHHFLCINSTVPVIVGQVESLSQCSLPSVNQLSSFRFFFNADANFHFEY